jgi:hypothetical protein
MGGHIGSSISIFTLSAAANLSDFGKKKVSGNQ